MCAVRLTRSVILAEILPKTVEKPFVAIFLVVGVLFVVKLTRLITD